MVERVRAAAGGRKAADDAVVRAVQLLVVEGGRLITAFAARHGLHPTDVEALLHVLLAEAQDAPLTAGRLGAELELTSGAVTAVIDRLERTGHVTRDRDLTDRRRVLLRHSPAARELAAEYFAPLSTRVQPVLDELDDDQVRVVQRFLDGFREAMAEHRQELG